MGNAGRGSIPDEPGVKCLKKLGANYAQLCVFSINEECTLALQRICDVFERKRYLLCAVAAVAAVAVESSAALGTVSTDYQRSHSLGDHRSRGRREGRPNG